MPAEPFLHVKYLFQLLAALRDTALKVHDSSLVLLFHEGGGDHKIGRGLIRGNRDIVDQRDTQQRPYIRIVRLRAEGIGKEDDKIDHALNDLCADLLVAAEGAAVIGPHREPGALGDHGRGRTRAAEEMLLKQRLIPVAPVEELLLLSVMGDQRDILLLANG